MKPETISLPQARRIALAAQGFANRRSGSVSRQTVARIMRRVGLFQIDSVNVVTRAHYMPFFSRAGPYPQPLLDRTLSNKPRLSFEYWAHEASLLPVETQPFLRWRIARARDGRGIYGGLARFGREHRPFIDRIQSEVEKCGPLTAADIEGHRGASGWWEWSDAKRALEWLFWAGFVTTQSRGPNFERRYDLTERVLPRHVIETPTPAPPDAQRALIEIAARALGIATRSDLRDYFRLAPDDAYPRIGELVEEGALLPVSVRGWPQTAYLHRDAKRPRKISGAALLAPFDPLVWERSRAERLFDFRYRLEIYTPAHKRVHGYYVYPFLLDERIVARVDLKADRKAGVLRLLAAHEEPSAPPETAVRLLDSLREMSDWLGLERVEVEDGKNDFTQSVNELNKQPAN